MIRFIAWLILGFISTFSFSYLYYRLTDSKQKINFKIVLFYLFGVISVTLVSYFDIPILNSFFFFLYFPIMFYILNHMPIKKLFFHVMIVWFYGIVIDILTILCTSLFFYIFNINFNIYINYSEIVSMLLTLIVSIILIFLARVRKIAVFTENLYKKIDHIKYFDVLLVVFAIFIFCLGFAMFLNIKDLDINILLMLVIILMIITFVILLKYKIDSEEMAKYLDTLKENNNFYIKIEDENRIFRHNLNAKLLSIKSVSNKKAMLLIDDLLKTYNKKIDFSNHMKVIPYGLNGVIYQKLYPYLKELNIMVYNDIDYDVFDYLQPRRYNVFVEKLVLALDNAIEASLNSKEKILIVNLYDDNDCISIEVKNTFSNTIDIDQLGTKNYSSKGKKRGLGLFSSFRDNEASLKVSVVNDMFVSKITAKKRLNS